jgi:hypothetical protein
MIQGREVSATISKVQQVTVDALQQECRQVLVGADNDVFAILPSDREDVSFRFQDYLNKLFEVIKGNPNQHEPGYIDFDNLSLILEDELEVLVAVEGMVAAARNKFLPHFISFNTRLNAVLEDGRVNESNNPLDPDQLFTAFKEATRPLGMNADRSLGVFRLFNAMVVGELESILETANQILIEDNVLPDLALGRTQKPRQASARREPRSESGAGDTSSFGLPGSGDVQQETYDPDKETPELFSMVQNLMHGGGSGGAPQQAGAASAMPETLPGDGAGPRDYVVPDELLAPDLLASAMVDAPPSQPVTVVQPDQLQGLLSNIQTQLANLSQMSSQQTEEGSDVHSIKKSLAEILKEQEEDGVINAVDRQSSDVINLVEMLYEAIWEDSAVPIPIKELIGRTQITVMQVALSDTSFFNREDHPTRALLNEFAKAGIGWSSVEKLEEDSLYQKISGTVQQILQDYNGEEGFFEALLKDFRTYRAREAARGHRLEQRIKHTREGEARAEFARKLVTQRIEERILGRDLDPFVRDLLSDNFHKFMVLLVLKEGPGSKAWKQAINTIDVLLWSVQPHEQKGDRDRLDTINPRLLNNLKRALRIASMDAEAIEDKIEELQKIQLSSFQDVPEDDLPLDEILDTDEVVRSPASTIVDTVPPAEPAAADEELAEDDETLKQVDEFGVGTWFEFLIEDEQNVRCKLAARINAIDKLIFVNRQGVKVIEKTRMGLAIELKNQSVTVISDGLLFSRALESVIGDLRQSQAQTQPA